ncbi:hypothetical protein GLAREA_01974 [Glarea lozoyensis ATCC 20868]|uniref:Spindle pole body component n=1 Tax=Glarea lozoyensis (strain ATCC 20868 / MF5171) TaxID=1116229 RepID=S3CHV6_GLAL2|nr:uncharacterized protein GLAREA_01974 [Glarea lozoyensis ATCC 20868]EPE26062.1 hypothetical protein GLAREA_01974 [Glarea lozoyensis ATCC 20868]
MDYNDRDLGQPFTIPDLWAPSQVHSRESQTGGILFSQHHFDDIDLTLPDVSESAHLHDDFFRIPQLDLNIPTSEPLLPKTPAQQNDLLHVATEEPTGYGDIWLLPEETPLEEANFKSWDVFVNESVQERQTPYITELDRATFDAALVDKTDLLRVNNSQHVVVDSRTYTVSLLALGLGRSSVIFAWNEEKQTFISAFPEMRISGFTGESMDALLTMFMDCGNITKSLQRFIHQAYTEGVSPSRVALADTVSTLLSTIQARLSASSSMQNSLLQLQSLFSPTHSILQCFQQIIDHISTTRNDESMLSTIYEEIQLLDHRTDSMKEILLEVLARVSRPWLNFCGEWLGIQRETELGLTMNGPGKSFVSVENKEWVDEQGMELDKPEFVLNFDKIPSFITPEDARVMFEVGRSLRYLREHHSDHPLARPDVVAAASPPKLDWRFSWDDILETEAKATQYETDLLEAVRVFTSADTKPKSSETPLEASNEEICPLGFFGKTEADMQARLLASIDVLNESTRFATLPDALSTGLNDFLLTVPGSRQIGDQPSLSAPVSLLPLLSFNHIISAQARIVNGTCMRMFFKNHNLREHLDLQHSFHLLGNGVFSSKLSHALFDPELETAERQRGIARSGGIMGLRLGERDNWPPASSELQLALMGLLAESHISRSNQSSSGGSTFLAQSLPGDLSFAVRDMSEDQIEKCMNPNSVEALDFLRLSYKPPQPLDAVITPVILYKYDQIFKLLLRLIRMLYVVSALFQHATTRCSRLRGLDGMAQRFRIEAQQFVSSVCGYFFDTGIAATWQVFQRKLDQVEERFNTDNHNFSLGQDEGIDKLRDYHEKVVDRIMFVLLLRKRQQPVMKLLEEIFTLILQFSERSRQLGLEVGGAPDKQVGELYAKFQRKVGVFITVCKSLSEKAGYGEKTLAGKHTPTTLGLFNLDDLAEENTICQLLLRLEMNHYYGKTVNV